MSETENDRSTKTYSSIRKKQKKRLEQWKRDHNISDKQMKLLMERHEIRNLDPEEKKKGNHNAEMMVLGGVMFFLAATALGNREMLVFASIYVLLVTGIWFSGALNPYARKLKAINKELKKYPKAEGLDAILQNKKGKEDETDS